MALRRRHTDSTAAASRFHQCGRQEEMPTSGPRRGECGGPAVGRRKPEPLRSKRSLRYNRLRGVALFGELSSPAVVAKGKSDMSDTSDVSERQIRHFRVVLKRAESKPFIRATASRARLTRIVGAPPARRYFLVRPRTKILASRWRGCISRNREKAFPTEAPSVVFDPEGIERE